MHVWVRDIFLVPCSANKPVGWEITANIRRYSTSSQHQTLLNKGGNIPYSLSVSRPAKQYTSNSLINPKDSTKGMTAQPMPAWRRVPVYIAKVLRAMAAEWSLDAISLANVSATFMAVPSPQAVKLGHSSSEDWSDSEAVDSVWDLGDKLKAPGLGTAIIGSESNSSMFLDWFCVNFKWPCTYAATQSEITYNMYTQNTIQYVSVYVYDVSVYVSVSLLGGRSPKVSWGFTYVVVCLRSFKNWFRVYLGLVYWIFIRVYLGCLVHFCAIWGCFRAYSKFR